MAAPERVPMEEHDALNPPVIPCFLNSVRPGRKLAGITPQIGWEGFKIIPGGDGYKVMRDPDFTLYILEDGYCEIPGTPFNKKKLEVLLKPTQVFAPQKTKVMGGDEKEVEVVARDEAGKVIYTDKLLREEPPVFRRAAAVRTFDPKESTVDYVRPWLRPFVNVPGAHMEPIQG